MARCLTELWQGRDTPTSFVQAIDHGYILAQDNRPFLLVDINGHTNALPKLIDDKAVTQGAVANS